MASLLCSLPAQSRAEIIIDDFDDDVRIEVPEENSEWSFSENVGDLEALRRVSVNGIQTDPVGFVDIGQLQTSKLVADIPKTLESGSAPILSINLNYELTLPSDGVDLSEAGKNNALILDIEQLTADIPLPHIRLLVQQTHSNGSSSYVSSITPIPQSSSPFALAFPFESFKIGRGSPIENFDFSFVFQVDVTVRLAFLDSQLPEDLNFQMRIDRLRAGRIVPEPSTLLGCACFLGVFCIIRFKCCGLTAF